MSKVSGGLKETKSSKYDDVETRHTQRNTLFLKLRCHDEIKKIRPERKERTGQEERRAGRLSVVGKKKEKKVEDDAEGSDNNNFQRWRHR